MKGLAPLFLGIFGTFAFSWIGLTVIPTWQIGSLNPQSDEEGTDIYPLPQSGMFARGGHVYAANGCVYCHSQQVRPDYVANDIERKWGNRRSAPRDYIFERPVFLGKMRMGQDLANIGARAPAPEESPTPAGAAVRLRHKERRSPVRRRRKQFRLHRRVRLPARLPHIHQRHPVNGLALLRHHPDKWRTLLPEAAALPQRARRLPARHGRSRQRVCRRCILPPGITCISIRHAASISIRTCRHTVSFTKSDVSLESVRQMRCNFQVRMRRREGWEVVPTFDAKCVVAYLMGLNQSHPLKEVRSVGGAPATGGAPSPAVQAASPAPAAAGSPAAAKK